jgi:hypothetical protein
MKVCKQFGLQDMIERESETIDTQLGFWFEVGGRYARACLLFFYTSSHFDAKDDAYSNANFEFWIERSGQMW